jgi:hypothetical protein
MTEEEAKTKWCPMVRFQIGTNDATWQGNAYTNRGEVLSPPESVMCIASDCMMWRWWDSNKYSGRCGLTVGGDR